MTSTCSSNPDISHNGLVLGWPESTVSNLFDRAKLNFGELAAAVVLPHAGCADVDQALRELVRIVLALYPAWMPEAQGIDGPAGAGDAAVADLARATAQRSSLFGPLLLRLARAALAKQTSAALEGMPLELVASECGKLIRASYTLEDIILILPSPAAGEIEIEACERTALWLAEHVKCAVWIAGPAAARMPRIGIIRDAVTALAQSDEEEPTGTLPPPPWVTPLAGRPNPFSTAEQRLEMHLAAQDWADGRAWNQGWQAGAKHNRIVIDLVWKREQLVVEIDGPDHLAAEKFAADRHRDRLLQLEGFAVLRFTNEEVLNDPALVASQIERFLRQKRIMKKS